MGKKRSEQLYHRVVVFVLIRYLRLLIYSKVLETELRGQGVELITTIKFYTSHKDFPFTVIDVNIKLIGILVT